MDHYSKEELLDLGRLRPTLSKDGNWSSTDNHCFHLVNPKDGLGILMDLFPDAKADGLNFVIFSVNDVYGDVTIEEAEAEVGFLEYDDVNELPLGFLILNPRNCKMFFGACIPDDAEDIRFLKALRSSSVDVISKASTGKFQNGSWYPILLDGS